MVLIRVEENPLLPHFRLSGTVLKCNNSISPLRAPPSDARNEHDPALAKASLPGEITGALKDGTRELPSLPDIALEVRSAATCNREFKILYATWLHGVAIFRRVFSVCVYSSFYS
jgi:hypothetical protein